MTPSAPATWSSTDVDLTTVERQISNLWKRLAEGNDGQEPVRTHVFNLIAYTRSESDARKIREVLHGLAQRHPSRTIVLVGDRSAGVPSVDADVTVACAGRPSSGVPLGHEEIVLHVHGRAADHMSSVVVPLLMPELPTYLWWPGQPPFGHRSFHDLLAVTDQLVIDSADLHTPGDAFSDLARLCSGRQGVHDFNWARLRPWREVIAQFFDSPAHVPYARGIRSASVEFGAGEQEYSRAAAGLLLMVSWMASRLDWHPDSTLDEVPTGNSSLSVLQDGRVIPIDIRFVDHGEHAAGRLIAVELRSQPSGLQPGKFAVRRTDDLANAHVTTQIHGEQEIDRVVPLNRQAHEELLGKELDLAGQDSLYSQVAFTASQLAGREVWLPQ